MKLVGQPVPLKRRRRVNGRPGEGALPSAPTSSFRQAPQPLTSADDKRQRQRWETRGANSFTCPLGPHPHPQSRERPAQRHPLFLQGECSPGASARRHRRSQLGAHSFASRTLTPQRCTPKTIPQGSAVSLQSFRFTDSFILHGKECITEVSK